MSKLQEIKTEFDDHKDKLINQSDELIKRSIEEMENAEITPEQLEILEDLKNKSGIEVDGSDIGDILDDLSKSFDIKTMAAPYKELMKGAEETAVTSFMALYELDEEEYSEDRVLAILKDTLDFLLTRYTIDASEGLTDVAMTKIIKHPVLLSELPYDFRTIVFGENTLLISVDKYQRKMTEALLPLAQLSMKESIDAYIDRQAIEMELFSSQEKLLAETKKRMKEDKTIALDIMRNIVDEVKKTQPNLKVLNKTNTIKINYFKNIKALKIMAELCEQAETDNDELKQRMTKQANAYREKAQILERIINLEFTNPLKVYHEAMKGDHERMNKELPKQLESFIHRVAKYKFSVPMPGYSVEDKTYSQVIKSMKKYYSDTLEEYYKQRELLLEDNPDLDLPIFMESFNNGKYLEDFGGDSFTMIILLTLARFDKKHLKHVDFDLEKNKVMEYYLVYELLASLHNDVFTLAELIKFANTLL